LNKQIKISLDQIRKYDTDGKYQPVYIGELGSYVYRTPEKPPALYEDSLYIAEASIRALEYGVSGIAIWAWNMHSCYAAISYPGAWWEIESKETVNPIPEKYYPFTLLMQSIPRGSQLIRCKVVGSEDASRQDENWPIRNVQRIWACAFKTPSGDLNVVIVNDSYLSKNIELSGLLVESLQKRFVSKSDYSRIFETYLRNLRDNRVTDTLPARSIVVYSKTTLKKS
jgi:hypothetical protein